MWYEHLADDNQLSFKSGASNGIKGKAIFNTEGTRRYYLERCWNDGEKTLTAIMMNPSTATHDQTDDTLNQLMEVADDQLGYDGLCIVNVSSIVNGNSGKLTSDQFAYDSINWAFISGAISQGEAVFLGWGVKGQQGIMKQSKHHTDIKNIFRSASDKLYAYEVLKSKDKKFVNYPVYYAPHPRPRQKKNKYCGQSIRRVTEMEFVQIFIK